MNTFNRPSLAIEQPGRERRMFVIMPMPAHLMRHMSPDCRWWQRFENLLAEYPDIPLGSMGVVDNREEHPVWVGR